VELLHGHNVNKILVVGGTGFIGSHVVDFAIKHDFKVTVLSKTKIIKNRNKSAEYISSDLINSKQLSSVLTDRVFDCVINLGGYIDHSNYSKTGKDVFDVHFGGTKNLIDCLNREKLRVFIQIGSSDEYGNNNSPQNEQQREDPISMYSCAKVMSTYFLQTLFKTENFPVVILRPFLVYGPGQGLNRLIPHTIDNCLEKNFFPVSKGHQLRDFCFVDDFVEAIFMSIDNKKALGQIINISSGVPLTVKSVINRISSIVKSGTPNFGEIKYRDSENMKLYAETNKAKKILNWEARTDINTGLHKTINWVKSNKYE